MREFSEVSFELEKSYEYILSIQVRLDGFSFSVVRPSDSFLLYFKNTPLKISSSELLARRFKEWFNSEELLQKPYKKVRVIVFSENFTFVPYPFLHKDTNDEVLHILFQNTNNLQFAENLVKTLNAKLLFSIPDGMNEVFQDLIGEFEITHPLKPIVNHLLKTKQVQLITLLFSEKNLQLALIEKGELLLANNFKINHANDVLYYLLTVLKQFDISTKQTRLFYTGKSSLLRTTMNILPKYFKHIECLKPDKINNVSNLTEEELTENASMFL